MSIKELSEKLQYVALYLAVALIAAFIVVGLLVWFFKREKFNDFKKYAIGITAGFAITVLVAVSYIEYQCNYMDMATYGRVFYSILAAVIVAVAGAIAILVCSLFGEKPMKIAGFIVAILLAVSFIVAVVEVSIFYKNDRYQNVRSSTGLIVSAVVCILVLVAFWFLGDKRKMNDTRAIVYGAISIALSFALSYAKLFELPQGGSVTFASLLPLMIYCCMFGTRRGLVVCLIYGFLQAVQDPWLLHPMQFLLDYPLAFGLVGVSGIFMEKGVFKDKKIVAFLLGGILGVTLRYICHVCSGVFSFASLEDYPTYGAALVYSLTYNSFAFVDMAIALVAGSTLFASKSFSSLMQKSSDVNKAAEVKTQTTEHEDEEELDEIDKQIIENQSKSNKD